MSSDRELLEMAAKAAGMETNHHWNASRMALSPPVVSLVVHRSGELVSTAWNPLTHDGDALRLAVACEISFGIARHAKSRLRVAWFVDDVLNSLDEPEPSKLQPRDAMGWLRRTVVYAAAEIGKAMP